LSSSSEELDEVAGDSSRGRNIPAKKQDVSDRTYTLKTTNSGNASGSTDSNAQKRKKKAAAQKQPGKVALAEIAETTEEASDFDSSTNSDNKNASSNRRSTPRSSTGKGGPVPAKAPQGRSLAKVQPDN